jgi:AraC family transcriptional regulator
VIVKSATAIKFDWRNPDIKGTCFMKARTDPVSRALWYIETHFAGEITLDSVAGVSGVSRFPMSRAFGLATGCSIPQYVRGRRLTEAARLLAGGAPDILGIALDVGYGSHEAFSRAFREQFGMTPEAVRAQGHVDNLKLMEAIKMEETMIQLAPPRTVEGRAMLLAGLSERHSSNSGMPAQWQRFAPHIGNIPGQVGRAAYGVIGKSDDDGSMDYLTGVEVSDFTLIPPELTRLRLAPQKYAVFTHSEHVSKIKSTWNAIFNQWLPNSGYESTDAPEIERYGEEFDPRTGMGGIEIWVPVKS